MAGVAVEIMVARDVTTEIRAPAIAQGFAIKTVMAIMGMACALPKQEEQVATIIAAIQAVLPIGVSRYKGIFSYTLFIIAHEIQLIIRVNKTFLTMRKIRGGIQSTFNFFKSKNRSMIHNFQKLAAPLFITLALLYGCQSINGRSSMSETETGGCNTSITIHYTNMADTAFTTFQQYDPYYLKDYAIINSPAHNLEVKNLTTITRFVLKEPSLLLLGFNEFLVLPGSDLDISYSVLEATKSTFKDTVSVNNGNGFFIKKGNMSLFTNFEKIGRVGTIKNRAQIDSILAESSFSDEAMVVVNNIYLAFPHLKKTLEITRFIEDFYWQNNFVTLINAYNEVSHNLSAELRKHAELRYCELAQKMSTDLTYKTWKYWFGMQKLYQIILTDRSSIGSPSPKIIADETKGFDSITRQYFILLAVKKNAGSLRDWTDNDFITSSISFPVFRSYLSDIKNISGNIISGSVGDMKVYDYQNKENTFKDIFRNKGTGLIYLDFAGSWCIPCIDEISQYVKHRKFDSSDKLQPYWFFFENNNKDWLEIIERFNLKKENCFLILDNSGFSEYFYKHFFWEGEFPHHFLFTHDGELVNSNAPPLTELRDSYLNSLIMQKGPPLPPPPSPRTRMPPL